MRFLIVYSNQYAVGNKPIGIASIAAMLKGAGHSFELFDCTSYDVQSEGKLDWNARGYQSLEFRVPSNSERLPRREPISVDGLVQELLRCISDFEPDVIGLSALTDDYPLGLALMRVVKREFPRIPTIGGGVHASVDPEGVIREDCFDLVCVGEGEGVVLDIADRIGQGKGFDGIPNLWLKNPEGRVVSNAVRPFIQDMDVLPFPDWTIFGETAFYKPYEGYVYKYGDFEMSRGCPYKCSYCINVQMQEVYAQAEGQYHREKSIPRVVEEIKNAVDAYGIEFLKFWDETFLLMSPERQEEFCDLYASELGIPYVVETTAQSVTDFSVAVLQKTNCKSVSLGMETGNADLRRGILYKPTDNVAYVEAYRRLTERGIRKSSFNMIGLPMESQADIFRTIALNKLVETHTQSVGIFYPYKGTPIRDKMINEGWMNEDFDLEDLKNYDFNTFTGGSRSVVRFKDMDGRIIGKLRLLFASYVVSPVRFWPLIDYVKNNDDALAVDIFNNVQRVSYCLKFGEARDGSPLLDLAEDVDDPLFAGQTLSTVERRFILMLIDDWQGDLEREARGLLSDILQNGEPPEFPIPDDPAELSEWLLGQDIDEQEHRETRREFRELARANSETYASRVVQPMQIETS